MSDEFKQRPLKSMTKELEKTGKLLSGITRDRARCLDVVSKCQPFVSWLKNTIKGEI